MKYTVKFQLIRGGHRFRIDWDNGRLRGNPMVLTMIKSFLAIWKNKKYLLSPTGPVFKGEPVTDPIAFLVMCQEEFYKVRVTGAIPLLPRAEGIL